LKILAIIGSPRKEGNTYRAVKRIEETVKRLEPATDFEYLFLRDAALRMCIGCRSCFDRGEAACPHQDDLLRIADQMLQADGVIFASPTYVANMSGLMKNFLDRLAYFCHRPAFHDKKALLLSTTAMGGARSTLLMMAIALGSMGFQIVGQIGIAMNSGEILPVPASSVAGLDQLAAWFVQAIRNARPAPPSLFGLVSFNYNRKRYQTDDSSYDARYWKAKGWLEPGRQYFTGAKVNPFKKLAAGIIMKLLKSM
jgi:multimeric flavodoxin WrbA